MSEELRFAVRCCGSGEKAARRPSNKDIVDNNGIQFAPLTGMNHRIPSKELYARSLNIVVNLCTVILILKLKSTFVTVIQCACHSVLYLCPFMSIVKIMCTTCV